MEKNVIRVLSIALSILILTMAVGCSSGTSSETSTSTTAGTTVQEASASTKPAEPVTLSVIDWYSKNELTPAFEAWNKNNPEIQLKEEIVDGSNWKTIYTTRFQAGDAPDLLFMGQMPQWINNGYLMDITDRPAIQNLKNNAPELYSAREVNGKVYISVINSGVGYFPIFYNQLIFDKLKLSIPKTMDEFYTVCKVIKDSGVEPLVFGAGDWADFGNIANYYIVVDTLNQGIKNANNALVEGKATIPQIYEKTFTMLKSLADGGYISKASATLKYDQSVQYFADGKAAILPQGSWIPTVEAIKKADSSIFKLNSFLLPYPADSTGKINLTIDAAYGMAINAKTKYPEQAKKAFDGITSNDSIKTMCQGMGVTTVVPGVELEADPALKQSIDQTKGSNIKLNANTETNKYIIPASFQSAIKTAEFNIVVNHASVEKALSDVQKEWTNVKDSVKSVN